MEWAPASNVLTVMLARPFVSAAVPRGFPASLKTIEPVAFAGIDAVNVTGWPTVEGLSDEVRVIVGDDLITVTIVAGEVAGLLFASPGVLAVMESLPTGRVVIVIVATPPTTGTLPIGSVPL
jgi:hypothetical protein